MVCSVQHIYGLGTTDIVLCTAAPDLLKAEILENCTQTCVFTSSAFRSSVQRKCGLVHRIYDNMNYITDMELCSTFIVFIMSHISYYAPHIWLCLLQQTYGLVHYRYACVYYVTYMLLCTWNMGVFTTALT